MTLPRRWFDSLVLALLGGLLMALALPRSLVGLSLLPHGDTIESIETRQALDSEQLNQLADSLAAGQDWAPSAARQSLAAAVALRRFDQAEAVAAFRRAVRLAPGASDSWMMLADLLPPGPEAAHALRLSALTNAFDYTRTPRRVDRGLRLWPFLDAQDKQAYGRLVHALWQWETGRLAMIAAQRNGYDQIAPYFADQPEEWDHFTRSYAIYHLRIEAEKTLNP